MKRILGFCLLIAANAAIATTCPPANSLSSLPAGWHYVEGSDDAIHSYHFAVAAWGNHKDGFSSVRCHYYNSNESHIQIDSDGQYPELSVSAQPHWTDLDLYHLCVSHSNNVGHCTFN